MAKQDSSWIPVLCLGGMMTLIAIIVKSYFSGECCDDNWISLDVKGLEKDLKTKLFGQHIASEVILKAIKGSLIAPVPKKSLTMSLHGNSGTGKNLASQLIAANLYKDGMNSQYVHVFISTHHFPHPKLIDQYQNELRTWIHGNVTICPRSMFIFDEMDKMHPGLINAIKPFLDYTSDVDKVDYRKTIFIFLSNTGGEKINEKTLSVLMNGMERESIQLNHLEEELSLTVFNKNDSGFWHTNLIETNLIDHFIPFLPLEYKHVVSCVKAEIASRGLKDNEKIVTKIASKMVYYPKEEKVLSVKGCKTVASKVNLYF
ncbi:torsin-1A-like [Heptranchias perlo]|uniref:torsin-1A-like n=1 Tax=Heptranchias perlo TaxID=212740 RepID=UPI003559B943